MRCFPGDSKVKNPPAKARDAEDVGSIPGLGRSPGGGHGNPLENPMDRGTWRATVHRVAKSRTRLRQLSTHPRIKSRKMVLMNLFAEQQ